MFNLVLKDLIVQKRERTIFVLILLGAFSAVGLQSNIGISIGQLIFAVYFFTVYANAFDYKYNAEITINSLPIKRSQVVLAKYLSIFLFFALGVVFTFVPGVLFKYFGLFNVRRTIDLTIVLIALSGMNIYYSIFFPLYFKLGYMKSRWGNWLITALFMAIGTGVGTIKNVGEDVPVSLVSGSIDIHILLIMLLVSLGLLLISLIISQKIYANKEL